MPNPPITPAHTDALAPGCAWDDATRIAINGDAEARIAALEASLPFAISRHLSTICSHLLGLYDASGDPKVRELAVAIRACTAEAGEAFVAALGAKAAQTDALAKLAEIPGDARAYLAGLRADGWSVAVHNDYRLNGEARTFWLLTHACGRWIKGEGVTDEEALRLALAQALPIPGDAGDLAGRGKPVAWLYDDAGDGKTSVTLTDPTPVESCWATNVRPLYEAAPRRAEDLAKLAEIPAVGSEERERWLDDAGRQMADAKPGSDWVLSDEAILTLVSEARKQGQRDVLASAPTPVANGAGAPDPRPQSPPRSSPSEDGMTVEEAREVLRNVPYGYRPYEYATYLWVRGQTNLSSRIELALRILHDNGEVRG